VAHLRQSGIRVDILSVYCRQEEQENLFAFCSREERRISPCCREEKDTHPIQRIGETREVEGDKYRIQRWKGRYVISERD
jgi:hypothetical protein